MADPVNDWIPVSRMQPNDWQPVEQAQQPAFDTLIGIGEAETPSVLGPMLEPVLRAFGQGSQEGFGPKQLGLSEESVKQVKDIMPQAETPLRMINGAVAHNMLLRGFEGLSRGMNGLYRGLQAAGVTAGVPPDIVSMPEAFFGSPHPTGTPKPFVKPSPIKPIEYGERPPVEAGAPAVPIGEPPAPAVSRSQAARTGDPLVDAVLNQPIVRDVIDNAVVDREHTIPYEAGGSEPFENPTTYVDKHVPPTFTLPRLSDPTKTVTVDTAEPVVIHENTEMYVESVLQDALEKMTTEERQAAGISDQTPYKVGHFNFAEVAEHAWYLANDIDPAAAETEWKKLQPGIQHEIANETPPDLYVKEYPGADVTKARHEQLFESPPTPEETLWGRQIMEKHFADLSAKPVEPDLTRARDLGVLGKEEPPPLPHPTESVTPAEAAQAAVPDPVAGAYTKTTPAGEPLTSWQARFKEWVRRIKEPEDVKQFIEDAAAQNNNFPEARAGEVNPAHVEVIADAAGIDPKDIDASLLSSKFHGPTRVRMIKQLLDETLVQFRDAAAKFEQEPTEQNLLAMLEAETRRDYVVEYAVGIRAEWAHTGHALRDILNPSARTEKAAREPVPPKSTNLSKEVADTVDTAREVTKNIQEKNEGIGLAKLIESAQKLVDGAGKMAKEAKQKLPSAVSELVKTANAVKKLMDIKAKEAEEVPTVRPLRKLVTEEEKKPVSPLAKFNRLISEAERNVRAGAEESEGAARQQMPEELRQLIDQAREVAEYFGGAGLNKRILEILAEKGRTVDQQATLAKMTRQMTMEQTARMIANKIGKPVPPPTFWDKLMWYWVNGLISGPVTHTKYVGANALFAGVETAAVTPVAGLVGAVRRVLGGAGGVQSGEAFARAWGMVAGTPDAIIAATKAARTGLQTPLPGEVAQNITPKRQAGITFQQTPIQGAIGTAVSIPSKGASAIHTTFNFLGYRASIEAQAYRLAVQEGLSPTSDAFWQRRQELAAEPTVDMMNQAIEEGYRLTYINELGPTGKAISAAINKTKVGRLILPFTHIPFNILSRGIEYTPLTLISKEARGDLLGKNGAVKQDMAIARLVVGGAVGIWAVNMVANDRMTGYGPMDEREKAQWLATGHQPYSIRIGDEWYSFNRFGSIGVMLGLFGNLGEAMPHMQPDAEELTKALFMSVHATGRLLEDEVGMQGLAGLMEIIDQPERKGTRAVSNFVASFLPYSSLLRQTASAMDPEMREAKTITDGLRYYIPGMRQELLPKRDWLGNPVPNPGYGGDLPLPGMSAIIRHGQAIPDNLAVEMKNLDLRPAPPSDRIGGIKLTPELYDHYQVQAGALTELSLRRWVDQPGWSKLPIFVRQEIMRDTIRASRDGAQAIIQAANPQIIQQAMDNRYRQIQGEKPVKKMSAP